MTDTPSPGLLFPISITCDCRWRGIELDRAGAYQLWAAHAARAGHDLATTSFQLEGE